MKLEDINALLSKAVSDAMGGVSEETAETSTDSIKSLEKSIKSIGAKVDAFAQAAANGFEKPKTVEDHLEEFGKKIEARVEDLIKKATGKEDAPEEKLPESKGDLEKMIEAAISKVLEKKVTKGAPKGSGKEGTEPESKGDLIDSLDDDDVNSLAKSLLAKKGIRMSEDLSKEESDAAGNVLSPKQKVKRAELDDFFGKMVEPIANKYAEENSDEGEEEETEEE